MSNENDQTEKKIIKLTDILMKICNYVIWASRLLFLFDVIMIVFAIVFGIRMDWLSFNMIIVLLIGALLWAPVVYRIILKLKEYRIVF